MSQMEAAALVRRQSELVERQATLLALLDAVVVRTGQKEAGYDVLKLVNDMAMAGRREMPTVDGDPMGVLRAMVNLVDHICATIEAAIAGLDS